MSDPASVSTPSHPAPSTAPAPSRHSLEIQMLKTKLSQLNNDIDDDRVSHNRAITLNDTYTKATMEYLNIFAVLLVSTTCAYFFFRINLISMMLIVIIIACVVLIILFSKIQKRDNIYYDEIDPEFAPPEKIGAAAAASKTSEVKTESKVAPLSYCGCQCCSAGTVWNATSKTCTQGFATIEDAYISSEKKKCSGIYKNTNNKQTK
jgi:hypothetical protein